jgi:hypothetical protein
MVRRYKMLNAKVAKLIAVRDDLENLDFDGLKGEDLWNSIWLVRKIKHIIEGTKKEPGLDKQGCDKLHLEATEIEGVYNFSLRSSKRLDQTKFETLICERFGVNSKELESLREECKSESTSIRLDFNEKYCI